MPKRWWKRLVRKINQYHRQTDTRGAIDPPRVCVLPSSGTNGEILVMLDEIDVLHPVRAYWTGDIHPKNISADTLRACNLVPGEYGVHIEDASGARSGAISIELSSTLVPTISSYEIAHTSNDLARDGTITAHCENVSVPLRIVWSPTGAITNSSTLTGVAMGTYVATIIQSGDAPCHCLHATTPAVVDVEEEEASSSC